MTTTSILRSGLHFGEGPRWHDGRLWYSDFYDHAVHAINLDGNDERIVEVPGQPSGLGWLPDGSLVVSSMTDQRVLRWDGTSLTTHADLTGLAGWWVNDLVVTGDGTIFVGDFGFDLDAFLAEHGIEGVLGEPGPTATVLPRVAPDGTRSVAATDRVFPNGSVITPDGMTLIVAETLALGAAWIYWRRARSMRRLRKSCWPMPVTKTASRWTLPARTTATSTTVR
jgi:sugar lactone lactonase YvrE